MARRSLDEAMEKYGNDGGEFFKLENDMDVAVVRILHEGTDLEFEEDWVVAHEVEIEGKKRWVQCTEESDCAGCRKGLKAQIKLFLQLIQKDDPSKRKLWERGKTFIPTIRGLINQYGDLCNRAYEIERHGVAGDRNTTYELFPLDRDDKRLSDIPVERQKLVGAYGEAVVLKLSADDFEDAVDGRYRPERPDARGERGRGDREDRGSERGRSERGSDRGSERRESRGSERSSERSSRESDQPSRRRDRASSTDASDIF